jgi:hypothetical protein
VNEHPLARRARPRRALTTALAAAALAAGPAPAPAVPPAASAAAPDWRVGSALGFEFGMGDADYTAAKLRVEAERPVRDLAPEARLSAVVSLGLSHPSGKVSVPIAFDPFLGFETADLTWDANVFELVPAARVVWAASPNVAFYGDGGLGLAYTVARATLPSSLAALGVKSPEEDGLAAVLRLGAGALWSPTPSLRVGLEALGLQLRFGNGVGSAYTLVASLSHRL